MFITQYLPVHDNEFCKYIKPTLIFNAVYAVTTICIIVRNALTTVQYQVLGARSAGILGSRTAS